MKNASRRVLMKRWVVLIKQLLRSVSLFHREIWQEKKSKLNLWLIEANMCPLMSQDGVLILASDPQLLNNTSALVFRSDSNCQLNLLPELLKPPSMFLSFLTSHPDSRFPFLASPLLFIPSFPSSLPYISRRVEMIWGGTVVWYLACRLADGRFLRSPWTHQGFHPHSKG